MVGSEQHHYEGIAIEQGAERPGFFLLSRSKDARKARRVALRQAVVMTRDFGFDRVKVYHSNPSPGAQRRYVGQVFAESGVLIDGTFMDTNGHQESIVTRKRS